ncbi:MAG: hypothetical protein P0Y56_07020 [Candidatus Andeanibacterium colombiense]|uniref:Uncharacterized protein n=1 Tax=Candidatus Andeanibacterium colombiense TaxID=3121345 RepID=A0AAJ6BP32_9SPHN|nr:MAG: hypothetical protein P0Y56_07020 [Sphingomonadaceae bacterium]
MPTDQTIDQTDEDAPLAVAAPLRGEAMRRLQIGLAGLSAMILLVSLANIIRDRAQITENTTVPNASASLDPESSPAKDPLADAGVVPELPASGPSAGAVGGAQSGKGK